MTPWGDKGPCDTVKLSLEGLILGNEWDDSEELVAEYIALIPSLKLVHISTLS